MRMTEWELRPAKSYQGNGLLEQEDDSFTMQDVLVGMIKILLKDRGKPEWRRLINA